jgi:hypothetical protein
MLRKSRSHLAVQHQPLLTGSDVGGGGHNVNWSLDSIATVLMQTSEASTTTFKDEALEVTVILHWLKRACVKFRNFEIKICRKFNFDFGFRNGNFLFFLF